MTIVNSSENTDFARKSWTLAAILALWGVAVAVLAQTGVYREIFTPLLGPIIAAGMALPFVAYLSSPGFRSWVEAIGLRRLTAFHVWRTPAALLFFWYGAHNWLPEAFVRDAGWGDFGAGIFALIVTLLPESRGRYLAFHLYGLADLAVALGTGMTLTLHGRPTHGRHPHAADGADPTLRRRHIGRHAPDSVRPAAPRRRGAGDGLKGGGSGQADRMIP